MKNFLLLMVLLSTLIIGGCALSTDEYGQAKFLDVDVVDLLPEEAKQQQDVFLPANSNIMTMSLRTSFNESSTITPLNSLNVLSIEYDGFFSLIIDIENPNKDSIHEIRVKNKVSGISHTYQPSQKEDLDGDGIDDDLFYVNGDISTIFLGIKLPKDHAPGDVVSYSVESITYFESGVVKFVQMDPLVDPVITINVELTNTIFGVEFDKTLYTYDYMRNSYEDAYVMLSVFNKNNVDYYSVNLIINGVEKTYDINKLPMFRKTELNFSPTCPFPYNNPGEGCESVIVQIPGEDLAILPLLDGTQETLVINEFGSEEITKPITVEVVGINSSERKDTEIYDSAVVTPGFDFKTIQYSATYVINNSISVSNAYQDITFDFSESMMSDIDVINVRLYDVTNYVIEHSGTCGEIIFGDYGFVNNLGDYILLTNSITTLPFDLGTYQYCAVFVDGSGNPINNNHAEHLSFTSEYDTTTLAIPTYTWLFIESSVFEISLDFSEYYNLFDVYSMMVYNQLGTKWSHNLDSIAYVDSPIMSFNVGILSDEFGEYHGTTIKIVLYIQDQDSPGGFILVTHIFDITLDEATG